MKIDFRRDFKDPVCLDDPPVLACDGTHIGVSIRMLQLTAAATDVDNPEEVLQHHRR